MRRALNRGTQARNFAVLGNSETIDERVQVIKVNDVIDALVPGVYFSPHPPAL